MTSEVLIMNKNAVALAADSAVTVSMRGSKKEQKYFKGVNKVFELSNHEPVGIMIFDGASIFGVPWEVIIKELRKDLRDAHHLKVKNYAEELFDHVRQMEPKYFDASRQETYFKLNAQETALNLFEETERLPAVGAAEKGQKKAERDKALNDYQAKLAAEKLPVHFTAADIQAAKVKFAGAIQIEVDKVLAAANLSGAIDAALLTEVAIEAVYRRYQTACGRTGIVVAGFGKEDLFPSYVHYDCYGFMDGKLILDVATEHAVGVDNGSHINAFATTEMAETFMMGISPDVHGAIVGDIGKALNDLEKKVVQAISGKVALPNLSTDISACVDAINTGIRKTALVEHYLPLMRAVGSLPVDEIANLAETLIMLESLKEKVTRPSESVGGPVDVAVITRAEGLVWVKRKHYFPGNLNPKFFERQRRDFQ